MKKKTTAAASGAAKRRKGAAPVRKSAPGKTGTKQTGTKQAGTKRAGTKAAGAEATTRGAVASGDKSTIRRLRAQLALAQARCQLLFQRSREQTPGEPAKQARRRDGAHPPVGLSERS